MEDPSLRSQARSIQDDGEAWPSSSDASSEATIRPLQPADLVAVAAYDTRLFGVERAHILGALQRDHPSRCLVAEPDGQIVGYLLSRPGARAWHLGPLAADDPQTPERLAWTTLLPEDSGEAGSSPPPRISLPDLVMDVVMPNVDAVALAGALGLTSVRRFIQMVLGEPPPSVDVDRLYTSAGPELG